MSASRLPAGGRIDRARKIPFRWNRKVLYGYRGDTLASALLANDVSIVGRSFKYHRPRGVMSAGVEESGALVSVGEGAHRDPNVKATTCELYPNLVARGQNAFPSVGFDLGAASNLFSRFFAAGFYYKTFMGPRISPRRKWGGTAVWMGFEKAIRRAAGLGVASREPDPDSYEHAHAHCDVLVVGSGVAGLAAATTAARAGLEVWLVEQDFEFGGELLNQPSAPQLGELIQAAEAAGVRMLARTTAFGAYDHGVSGLLERVGEHLENPPTYLPRQRLWTLRARHTILATGALERGFAFANNDRPGVMLASAGRAYLNRYGVLLGKRVVVAGNNDSMYPVAAEIAQAGAAVTVLDARKPNTNAEKNLQIQPGVTLRHGHAPCNVRGGRRINALEVAADDGDGDGDKWRKVGQIDCDALLVSGGWSPTIHLHSQRGHKPIWSPELDCFCPAPSQDSERESARDSITCVGAAAGIWDPEQCQKSGVAAGQMAARLVQTHHCGKPTTATAEATVDTHPSIRQLPVRPLYEVRTARTKGKASIDPQHDVTTADVRLAQREGFAEVEHLKRYTTLGMATDGGKVGNVLGLALMAEASGRAIAELGSTVFRPPFTPVSLGALRGRSVDAHFRPLRRTPLHDWNLAHGAVMTMAGAWHRPWYFPQPLGADSDPNAELESISDSYIREATTVRQCVGLCDVTSLGKIAVQGADASEFLNRIYTNPFAKLPVGKARYGIMLRDDGLVMDDGTTWRLAESEYFMTTTTAHAGKVMAWLEELLHTRWGDLRVHVSSVSEQWAGCAVAGPKSRAVLAACMDDAATVGDEALPFMGVRELSLKLSSKDRIRCRIARISFSGEMAYEVYVSADYGYAMMDALWKETEKLGGCLYGLEALGALRIEKGHVTAAELDGRVSIDDAGLGKMASPNKAFIGSALRKRSELQRSDRPRLVGILPKNRRDQFNAGAILCRSDKVEGLGDGWVTAVTHSPAFGHWLGLGFIAGGYEAWRDRTVIAADPVRHAQCEVEIVSPHMLDPDGERMRG